MLVNMDGLVEALRELANERDWTRHHAPKNLAMALAGEVGELVAEFQWMTTEGSEAHALDAGAKQAVEDELADVLIYLAQLVDRLGVDIDHVVGRKLEANRRREWP